MQTIQLGQSDLKVTPICLGTMTFGEQVDEKTAHAILDRSLEMTVVRGSGRGSTFEPDRDGVVYRGTLAELPRSSLSGVIDPHVWAPGETNTYRITVTLGANAEEGDFADATFSWTASPAA